MLLGRAEDDVCDECGGCEECVECDELSLSSSFFGDADAITFALCRCEECEECDKLSLSTVTGFLTGTDVRTSAICAGKKCGEIVEIEEIEFEKFDELSLSTATGLSTASDARASATCACENCDETMEIAGGACVADKTSDSASDEIE